MSAIANQTSPRSLRPGFSEEWLRRKAPSVFAEEPMQGVSQRYSFMPTAQLVSRLRDSGWVPVGAFEQPVRLSERRGFQKHMIRFNSRTLRPRRMNTPPSWFWSIPTTAAGVM